MKNHLISLRSASIARFFVAVAGLILLFANEANADLVWKFTNDGTGNVRETITGSLDMSNGSVFAGTGATNEFVGSGSDLTVVLLSADAFQDSNRLVFSGDASNTSSIVNSAFTTTSKWSNTDFLEFRIAGGSNEFEVVDFAGTYSSGPVAISEDNTYAIPISSFN